MRILFVFFSYIIFILNLCLLPANSLAKPLQRVKSFTPDPAYLDMGEDCGTGLTLNKKGKDIYSVKIKTGCIDNWIGEFTGEGILIGQEMQIKEGNGFINLRFDRKSVNLTIKNIKFKTINPGYYNDKNLEKIGSQVLIKDQKEHLPIEE